VRRTPVHFAEDILMEEVTAMARAAGFHVRVSCGLIVVDRVPGIVAKDRLIDKVVTPIRKQR
jgi:hypothetical protein